MDVVDHPGTVQLLLNAYFSIRTPYGLCLDVLLFAYWMVKQYEYSDATKEQQPDACFLQGLAQYFRGLCRWASEGVDMLGRCRSAFYPVHTHSECSSVCLTGRPSFLLLIK